MPVGTSELKVSGLSPGHFLYKFLPESVPLSFFFFDTKTFRGGFELFDNNIINIVRAEPLTKY